MKEDKNYLYVGGLVGLGVVLLLTGVPPVYLLLLGCPIMMMLMMRGMNHGSMGHDRSSENIKHGMNHEEER